jgi:hypothetical protein
MPKRTTKENEMVKSFVDMPSTDIDIFYIKSEREVLEGTTFENPFDIFCQIIYPPSKPQQFLEEGNGTGDLTDLNDIKYRRDDLKIRDYLKNTPFTLSKSPHFALNEEKSGKRTTQGVVIEPQRPIQEKRWTYDLQDISSVSTHRSSSISNKGYEASGEEESSEEKESSIHSYKGYEASNEEEEGESESSLKGGIGSSTADEYILISDLSRGIGFVPTHSLKNGRRAKTKLFRFESFAKYVKKVEKDNTDMRSFLYSTLISFLEKEYRHMNNLCVIEIPVVKMDDRLSSDVSQVSSDRSDRSDYPLRRHNLIEQKLMKKIPVVYLMMHGGKKLFKNKETRKLQCRKMFKNPFQNLFRFIFANPGVSNLYYNTNMNENVFTAEIKETMTVEELVMKIDTDFTKHDIDTNLDLFQLKDLVDEKGKQTKEAMYIDKHNRKHFLVNYENTYVCHKEFELPGTPTQDFQNWGIFVLNDIDFIQKHENLLLNTRFIRYLERNARPKDYKTEDVNTVQGRQVEAITKLTNNVLFDFFKHLGFNQFFLIDESCESSLHFTKKDLEKFNKTVKDNEDELEKLKQEQTTFSRRPPNFITNQRKIAVDAGILELTKRRNDKEYYKRQKIEGLNDLIDYSDKRAKTRKRRNVSVIGNNRGPFI